MNLIENKFIEIFNEKFSTNFTATELEKMVEKASQRISYEFISNLLIEMKKRGKYIVMNILDSELSSLKSYLEEKMNLGLLGKTKIKILRENKVYQELGIEYTIIIL